MAILFGRAVGVAVDGGRVHFGGWCLGILRVRVVMGGHDEHGLRVGDWREVGGALDRWRDDGDGNGEGDGGRITREEASRVGLVEASGRCV
jgi:hypothetical protein